tara:strand:- start:2101 stop:2412 length:312 start_codon:yes stop_codon:yes gene_type:complete
MPDLTELADSHRKTRGRKKIGAIYQNVVVTNELPRIGSGYRLVKVQQGTKWVHVSDINGENKSKLSLKAWGLIKKGELVEPEALLKSLRKVDRMLGRRPRKKL